MYQLTSAIAKQLNGDGRWMDVAIGDIALRVLYSTYSRILATLTNPFLTDSVTLDVQEIRSMIGGSDITLNQFLAQNANLTLPTTPGNVVINPRFARYADGFHAGYKIQPIHPTASIDAQLPLSEKTWLFLTRPDTDYHMFYDYCLVSVNGFFHMTDVSSNGVYVQDGMKSNFLSGQNQLGIYSFHDIGKIELIPITEQMVYRQNNLQKFRDRAYVNLGKDVSDKTVMLVLGGYLHVLDRKTLHRIGDGTFMIDMRNLPLIDRYYESRKYLDFSSLNLETTSRNDSQVDVENFFSDETLMAYLTLSQSFFVVLDHNDIFINKIPVKKTPNVNGFVTSHLPVLPLVTGHGKMTNYWYEHEDGLYAISCYDTLSYNRLYDTVDIEKQISVSDSCDPQNPVEHGSAFFLEVGCDI